MLVSLASCILRAGLRVVKIFISAIKSSILYGGKPLLVRNCILNPLIQLPKKMQMLPTVFLKCCCHVISFSFSLLVLLPIGHPSHLSMPQHVCQSWQLIEAVLIYYVQYWRAGSSQHCPSETNHFVNRALNCTFEELNCTETKQNPLIYRYVKLPVNGSKACAASYKCSQKKKSHDPLQFNVA